MSEMEPLPSYTAYQSTPATPPGWYPDGQGQLAWWDGQQWTEHRAPMSQPHQQYAQGQGYQPSMMVTTVPRKTNLTFHLLMTLLTCGLWLPIWGLVALFNLIKEDKHITRMR